MSALCREFGISRKTGYKWAGRYFELGAAGLADLSRRPHSSPTAIDPNLADARVGARKRYPFWGPRKLRAFLVKHHPEIEMPAPSSIGEISPDEPTVRPIFESAFREFGLPHAMRSDNGPPFASTALGRLSRLSVWWVRLGIRLERIEPGPPEQNGRHERMHRTWVSTRVAHPRSPPASAGRASWRRRLRRSCRGGPSAGFRCCRGTSAAPSRASFSSARPTRPSSVSRPRRRRGRIDPQPGRRVRCQP
jgi:hypothetical protein